MAKNLASNDFASVKLAACPSVTDIMKDIYNNKFLTDVVLKTNTNSFPAHKIMLCGWSPVFKAMLSNDMKEQNSGSIQVDDLDDNTLQQMLFFLYSDSIEDLKWESATKLYFAADKYQIEKLKLKCSSFFIGNLTTSTAVELLVLAHTHSDSDLQKVVEDFIFEHDDEVFNSDEWEAFSEENPQLALKTMLLKYKTKKSKEKLSFKNSVPHPVFLTGTYGGFSFGQPVESTTTKGFSFGQRVESTTTKGFCFGQLVERTASGGSIFGSAR